MPQLSDILNELPGIIPQSVPPPNLLAGMIKQESGGNPNAVSPKGARGLLQTMPGTETDPGFGVAPLDPTKDPTQERLRVGQDYMGAMLKRYGGNTDYALAAYNWGPGNADKWIAKGADPAKLPNETRNYLAKVKGYASEPVPARTNEQDTGTPVMAKPDGNFDSILAELPTLLGSIRAPMLQVPPQLAPLG